MALGPGSALDRREWLKAAAAAAVGAVVGAGAHGYYFERRHVTVTRTHMPVAALPPALVGFRIGLLTDTHRSATVPAALLEDAVRLLLAERPDLIVLGGDYVTWRDRTFVGAAAEALGPLTAPSGVFAIMGNHDDERAMPRALVKAGFEVLHDARTTVDLRGERVDLIGLDFWTRTMEAIAPLVAGSQPTTILLAHDPRRLAQASALGISLVLSGHTHGGQVILPVLGAVAGRKFPVLAGAARQGDTALFVSRGVGTVYVPCRINCPPEVAILTLDRQARFSAANSR